MNRPRGILYFVQMVLWFFMWLMICVVHHCLTFPVVLFLSGYLREEKIKNTKSLVTKDKSTKSLTWQSNCWPQAWPSDSSQDVVYLSLFIVLCLKLHSSTLCLLSDRFTPYISLWLSLQIPRVCHVTTYPYLLSACGHFQLCIIFFFFLFFLLSHTKSSLLWWAVYMTSFLKVPKQFSTKHSSNTHIGFIQSWFSRFSGH